MDQSIYTLFNFNKSAEIRHTAHDAGSHISFVQFFKELPAQLSLCGAFGQHQTPSPMLYFQHSQRKCLPDQIGFGLI